MVRGLQMPWFDTNEIEKIRTSRIRQSLQLSRPDRGVSRGPIVLNAATKPGVTFHKAFARRMLFLNHQNVSHEFASGYVLFTAKTEDRTAQALTVKEMATEEEISRN